VAFAGTELEYWSWVEQAARQHPSLKGPWNQLRNQLTRINDLVDAYRSSGNEQGRHQLRDQVKKTFKDLADGEFWLSSSDPRAQFVKTLSEEDSVPAAFCYLWFVQPQKLPANDLRAVQGMMHGWMFVHALPQDRAVAEKRALEEVRGTWDRFAGTSKEQYSSFLSEFESLKKEIAALRTEQKEQFDGTLREGTEKLGAIAATYDEKLALQQPVKYWNTRAKRHRNLSIGYSIVFLLGVALIIGGVAWASKHVVPELWELELLVNSDAQMGDLPYWRIVVLVVLGGILAWPVRIVSRVLLSNLHLWTDAEERVTMSNTYLSLLRSDAGLEESDRKLILEALFRSAATGIVREDALGPGATSFWSRLVGGR
jgi:hypothetical protein